MAFCRAAWRVPRRPPVGCFRPAARGESVTRTHYAEAVTERTPARDVSGRLPDPVLARIVALTSAVLGVLDLKDVPMPLRRIARFTPAKRQRFGAAAMLTALDDDPDFRANVAAGIAEDQPESTAADRAAIAYLRRENGWEAEIAAASDDIDEPVPDDTGTVARLERDLEVARARGREHAAIAAAELEEARAAADDLRKQVRQLAGAARRVQRELATAKGELVHERDRASAALQEVAAVRAEAAALERRLRAQLGEQRQQASTARRSKRASYESDATRLRLLLDTLAGAAAGLRDELALPAGTQTPADLVAAERPGDGRRGTHLADPGSLDRVLALPRAHLIVDGYNVTKTGYAALSLAAQRERLLRGLGTLAVQNGAETTCVFDGSVAPAVAAPAPRGVRLIFSDPGQIADEVIRRLVGAEPSGRAVAVVSSDREVADSARRAGFYAVPSQVLLDRLGRG